MAHSIQTELQNSQIVPDVIPHFSPTCNLKIHFGSLEIQPGAEVSVHDVANQPLVSWEASGGSYYTLVNVDPDAPSRDSPRNKEWRHWLVCNIPGNDIKKGDVISHYMGAAPPQKSGPHRYVFLLYKQPGKIQVGRMNDEGMGRAHFKVHNFAKEHGLGDPIGANFYIARRN